MRHVSLLAWALVCLGTLFSSACFIESACTTEARASVQVTVIDAMGAAVTDAVLSYSVDGGAAKPCETMPDGGAVCGFEEKGNFTIFVTRGAEMKMQSVSVGADSCHVITESISIKLGV